jgi:hypothetical protein
MRPSLRAARLAVFFCALVAAACDRGAGAAPAREADATGDTSTMDGLSREELEKQARPLSPAEARQRGIADSVAAAAVEAPDPGAAAVRRPGAAPDTTRRDSAR